jgi:hypothetical protein
MTDLASSVTSLRPATRTEHELVAKARDGDHDAYRVLVRRYEELAFRTAYAITGSVRMRRTRLRTAS